MPFKTTVSSGGGGGGGNGVNHSDMYSGRQYWSPNNFSPSPNPPTTQGHHVVGLSPQHCYSGSPATTAYLQQQNSQHHQQQQQQQQQHHQQQPSPPSSLSHYVNANYGHIMQHPPSESTSPNLVGGCELMHNRSDGSLSSGEEEACIDAPSSDDLEQFAKQFKQRRIKLGNR